MFRVNLLPKVAIFRHAITHTKLLPIFGEAVPYIESQSNYWRESPACETNLDKCSSKLYRCQNAKKKQNKQNKIKNKKKERSGQYWQLNIAHMKVSLLY